MYCSSIPIKRIRPCYHIYNLKSFGKDVNHSFIYFKLPECIVPVFQLKGSDLAIIFII